MTSKFTTWVFPCPECNFAEFGPTAFQTGPVWHETGDKCPKCKTECRIKIGPRTESATIEAI